MQHGANELKAAKGKSLLRRFAEQVADPTIVILLAAAAISGVLAVLENDSFADVIIILAVVLINAVLGVYQESKAEKAIEALQDMAAATSKVVRDGKMSSILSKDLVAVSYTHLGFFSRFLPYPGILVCVGFKLRTVNI